jgi:lipoyl(octanoyl) transferase
MLMQRVISQKMAKKNNPNLESENYLLFVEHPHVYTLGKSGDEQNLLLNYIQLQAKEATFFHTDRGGDITYHGPGQLVGYPIFDLENFGIGLRKYIFLMEEAIIKTIAEYGLTGSRDEKATGVWLDAGISHARKICAIGVKSSRFVTMHGFALNVNTDLTYFQHINPCGFTDSGVTSIEKELGAKQDFEAVKKKVLEKMIEVY